MKISGTRFAKGGARALFLLAMITILTAGTTSDLFGKDDQHRMMPALSGNYTIGGGGNYASFTAAVNDLVANGVSGAVNFTVAAGTYTEQVTIPPITGASAVNTITFDGVDKNTRTLTYNTNTSGSWTVELNGADYVTFKNLKIIANDVNYGYVVYLVYGADATGANYDTFDNCIMQASSTSTTSTCSPLCISTSYSTYTNSANHLTVQNCTLTGGYFGMCALGTSSTTLCSYNHFYNNSITDWYYYGTRIMYQSYLEFIGNTVVPRTSNAGSTYPLYIYYCSYGPKVQKNFAVGGYYQLYAYSVNYASTSAYRADFSNNMLESNYQYYAYGAYLYNNYYNDFRFNTINNYSTYTASSYTHYVLYLSSGSTNTVQNNIFAYTGPQNTTAAYVMYAATLPFVTGTDFDYNLYFSTATNTTTPFYYSGTYYNWASLPKSPYNAHSVWGNPYFINPVTPAADLHSRSPYAYWDGLNIAAITTDIDGDTRHNPPCIGADEFPTPPALYDINVRVADMHVVQDRWSRNVTFGHQIHAIISTDGLEAPAGLLRMVYKEGSPPANNTDGVYQDFTPAWNGTLADIDFSTLYTPATTGQKTIYVKAFYPGDGNAANDMFANPKVVQDVKTFGYEDFDGFAVPGFSPGAPHPAEPWTVNNVNGGNTWQTAAGGLGYAGSQCLQYPGDGVKANDWVFTPGAMLDPGDSYRFRFKYRSSNGQAQTFQLAWGLSPDPTQMTVFETFSTTSTSWIDAIGSYGVSPFFNTLPTVPQPYYVGIHVTSNAGAGSLLVDNMQLDLNPVPPPKIGFAAPGAAQGQHQTVSDPPIEFTAILKKPGIVSKTYEVVNATYNYGVGAADFLWWVSPQDSWIKIAHETPLPTTYLPSNPYKPPRPRQGQTFTISIDPSTFAPGTYTGSIWMYGRIWNSLYINGIDASNQILKVPVKLTVIDPNNGASGGGSGGAVGVQACNAGLTPGPAWYDFADPNHNVFAQVQVVSGTIPSMCIEVFPDQLPTGIGRYRYVQRYFQVTANGDTWSAYIKWYYADNEMVRGGILNPDQLRPIRKVPNTGLWQDPVVPFWQSFPIDRSVLGGLYGPANVDGDHCLVTDYVGALFPKDEAGNPATFALSQNYPNPFNPLTNIDFSVPVEVPVKISVYNALGAEIATVLDRTMPAGRYTATFDASTLPSGTYVYRLSAGAFTQTRSMVVAK